VVTTNVEESLKERETTRTEKKRNTRTTSSHYCTYYYQFDFISVTHLQKVLRFNWSLDGNVLWVFFILSHHYDGQCLL